MMGVSTLDKKDQNRDYDHQDSLDESTQVRYLCTLSYCFKVCGNINIATRYWNEQFKCLFEKSASKSASKSSVSDKKLHEIIKL